MKKILFLIHDLGNGGAEKVLVNLANHLDKSRFDVTVLALFGGGGNEKRLCEDVRYSCFLPRSVPGNRKLMKLFTPGQLHRLIVRERYDVEIAYLEGPPSRVIAGGKDKNTRRVNWVHGATSSRMSASRSFRSEAEAEACYNRFDRTVCVAETVKENFTGIFHIDHPCEVLYNTVESDRIREMAAEDAPEIERLDGVTNLVAVGTLKEIKGYGRLLKIVRRLTDEGLALRLYLLGDGPLRGELEQYVRQSGLEDTVRFLGFQANPYKYVAKCDLFVCSSYREGFSTAATEALIVGTPVCTVEVSGMREMLGEHDEYGVVTENSEEALYQGLRRLLRERALLAHYRERATERGKTFSTDNSVKAVERMFDELCEEKDE